MFKRFLLLVLGLTVILGASLLAPLVYGWSAYNMAELPANGVAIPFGACQNARVVTESSAAPAYHLQFFTNSSSPLTASDVQLLTWRVQDRYFPDFSFSITPPTVEHEVILVYLYEDVDLYRFHVDKNSFIPVGGSICGNIIHMRYDTSNQVFTEIVLAHELGHYFGLCHGEGVMSDALTSSPHTHLPWSVADYYYLQRYAAPDVFVDRCR